MRINNLDLSPLDLKGERWVLNSVYKRRLGDFVIEVPKGFITDLASIPKSLWTIYPRDGRYQMAAIVHDYLYSEMNTTGMNRNISDMVFLKLMKEDGVGFLTRHTMYRAVRMFGEVFWREKLVSNGQYNNKAIFDRTSEAIEYYKYWNTILNGGGYD